MSDVSRNQENAPKRHVSLLYLCSSCAQDSEDSIVPVPNSEPPALILPKEPRKASCDYISRGRRTCRPTARAAVSIACTRRMCPRISQASRLD